MIAVSLRRIVLGAALGLGLAAPAVFSAPTAAVARRFVTPICQIQVGRCAHHHRRHYRIAVIPCAAPHQQMRNPRVTAGCQPRRRAVSLAVLERALRGLHVPGSWLLLSARLNAR